MTDEKTYYCEKCHRTLAERNFYKSNNTEKYPDGKIHLCKKCLTMHIDNWNPDTYLWILEELDVPYSPKAWDELLRDYGKDPTKLTGVSILGRYLSKMKLRQYKDFRWADTDYVQQLERNQMENAMKRQGYSAAEIDQAVREGVEVPPPPQPQEETKPISPHLEMAKEIEDSLVKDLTDEDKKYLCLQWGSTYRPDEWVRLEELYQQMLKSYDIQAAGDINTLKLACKSSLKANQLLDLGDGHSASAQRNVPIKPFKLRGTLFKTIRNQAFLTFGKKAQRLSPVE